MTSPYEAHSREFSHNNGDLTNIMHRQVLAELCKGWTVYRDNSEWINFRSIFTDDAIVWTTWSGARKIDEFIEISKTGKANGAFIQHRENGTLVELDTASGRAITKMKATITQRFVAKSSDDPEKAKESIVYDVDCDCRFIFFCLETKKGWKVKYVKLIYEKDKVVPVDGKNVPTFPKATLDKFPEGYKYLGAAQESLGYKVDLNLATLDDRYWGLMYFCMEEWLAGGDPDLFWDERKTETPNGSKVVEVTI